MKSGADLVNRLKKDPSSVSIGIPTALGGLSHTRDRRSDEAAPAWTRAS